MLKPKITGLTQHESGVYYAVRNIDEQTVKPQRLYLLGGTHGMEIAGPMAVMKLLEGEWRWPNVEMAALIQDPTGYKEEGYGFVGVDEHQSMWPPLGRSYSRNEELYWFYVDENSAWGNNVVVPPRHVFMREAMAELDPTFVVSLHETIWDENRRNLFWAGAGIFLIETYPMDLRELGGVMDTIGSPHSDPIRWSYRTLKDWLRPLWKGLRYQEASKALKGNPHYKLVTKIAEKYMSEGGRVAGTPWMRYLEHWNRPTIGPGRLIHDQIYLQADWKTVTDYAVGMYGCPGVTTETFEPPEIGIRGVDDRVEQQLLYVTSVLDVLNEVGNESN